MNLTKQNYTFPYIPTLGWRETMFRVNINTRMTFTEHFLNFGIGKFYQLIVFFEK